MSNPQSSQSGKQASINISGSIGGIAPIISSSLVDEMEKKQKDSFQDVFKSKK
ncbi:MAG: hypothetical protein WBA39_19940 [Rivularia sp. (in: cyanobacteria)]